MYVYVHMQMSVYICTYGNVYVDRKSKSASFIYEQKELHTWDLSSYRFPFLVADIHINSRKEHRDFAV